MSAKSLFQICVISSAAIVALFPPPSASVERWYSKGLYPAIQSNVTAASNALGLALFDTAILIFITLLVGGWVWWIRRARKQRSFRPVVRGVVGTITGAAIVYLWFLAAWGLNYARPPLESVLAYDGSRITPLAVRALAERAVSEANRTHAAAHAAGFPAIADMPAAIATALHEVERELGRPRATVLAQPKRSLLSPFFRASGVSGMLGPFFLETTPQSGSHRPRASRRAGARVGAPVGLRTRIGRQLCRVACRAARRPRVTIQRVARAGVGSR